MFISNSQYKQNNNQSSVISHLKIDLLYESWRDGFIVKGACCSFKGLAFSSQHPSGSSQLPATPALGH